MNTKQGLLERGYTLTQYPDVRKWVKVKYGLSHTPEHIMVKYGDVNDVYVSFVNSLYNETPFYRLPDVVGYDKNEVLVMEFLLERFNNAVTVDSNKEVQLKESHREDWMKQFIEHEDKFTKDYIYYALDEWSKLDIFSGYEYDGLSYIQEYIQDDINDKFGESVDDSEYNLDDWYCNYSQYINEAIMTFGEYTITEDNDKYRMYQDGQAIHINEIYNVFLIDLLVVAEDMVWENNCE